MAEQTRRGALIAFEGIDGAGKTTQVAIVAAALRSVGVDTVTSKEPTSGPWGARIRESARVGRMALAEELHAFEQDRHQHVREVIQPGLDRGAIVLLDRYFYSTIAYQGSRGADPHELRQRMEVFPRPATVFVLDVEPQVGLLRVARRDGIPNHFETMEQLARARQLFLGMNTEITTHVDGGQRVEGVTEAVASRLVGAGGPLQQALCAKHWGCDDPWRCTESATGQCDWWTLRRQVYAAALAEARARTAALLTAPTP